MNNENRIAVEVDCKEYPQNEIPNRFRLVQDPSLQPLVNIEPRIIYWKDEHGIPHKYIINEIQYVQRGVARKAGGAGIQYRIRIGRHVRDLFHDAEWFLEVPHANE